jgi:adenine deaminase
MLMDLERFEKLIKIFSDMPIKFYWSCRAVPQTPMEKEGDIYSVDKIGRLLQNPLVRSLAEITRWPEIIRENPLIMELIRHARSLGKKVDGHTSGAKYDALNSIARAGVNSCHESITCEEAIDRLRLGFYVMLRQSSLRLDLRSLLEKASLKKVLTDRMMLTTDGASPSFYQQFGMTDNLINIAIEEGVDPIHAYRMATINPAVYFGLDHKIGGIAPGRDADILVIKDLLHPTPETVISRGRIIAENKNLINPFPRVDWEKFLPKTEFIKSAWRVKSDIFKIPCKTKKTKFPTIRLISAVITQTEWVEFQSRDGFLNLNSKNGYCFAALVNRDGRWVTNGILKGFGYMMGGFASSVNTAAEILATGRDPEAMSVAVNRVLEIKGGIVVVENGRIVYEWPLPLGGMMSDASIEHLAKKEEELNKLLSGAGYQFHDPLYTLLFLPNDFLPAVRMNYQGVVDIKNNKVLWPRRDLVE